MNFLTISQYFNKLQSAVLIILILPLLLFIALYFHLGERLPDPRNEYFILLPGAFLLDWLIAFLFFSKKIKIIRKEQGLGLKLEKYFRLTIVFYSIISLSSMIMALGLYLTKNDVFTWLYIGGLILCGFLWPTASKTAKYLRLRGDEREMVYFKKDRL